MIKGSKYEFMFLFNNARKRAGVINPGNGNLKVAIRVFALHGSAVAVY
jgi:hypothetical protein